MLFSPARNLNPTFLDCNYKFFMINRLVLFVLVSSNPVKHVLYLDIQTLKTFLQNPKLIWSSLSGMSEDGH